MTNINIMNLDWDVKSKTFFADGKDVPFATSYRIQNPVTGIGRNFNFVEATGSEWDPSTIWIYKTETKDLTLKVLNYVPEGAAEAYLAAKTRY